MSAQRRGGALQPLWQPFSSDRRHVAAWPALLAEQGDSSGFSLAAPASEPSHA